MLKKSEADNLLSKENEPKLNLDGMRYLLSTPYDAEWMAEALENLTFKYMDYIVRDDFFVGKRNSEISDSLFFMREIINVARNCYKEPTKCED